MHEFFILLVGIFSLLLGAELVIRACLNIAAHYKISSVFLGLTVLAVGTDLPELVVHIAAAYDRFLGVDTSAFVVGELVGTSFGQIALTLGLVGLFAVLVLRRRQLYRDGAMLLGSVLLLFLFGYDGFSRLEGIVMLLVYLFYFLTLVREEKVHEKILRAPSLDLGWDILSIVGGFLLLGFSSPFVVDHAFALAAVWGVSAGLVGTFVVGLGTSLPELVVALSAVRRGAVSLSVAGLFGSNIFDALFVMGLGSLLYPIAVSTSVLFFDLPFLFLTSLVVVGLFSYRQRVHRKGAMLLLGLYVLYAVSKLLIV